MYLLIYHNSDQDKMKTLTKYNSTKDMLAYGTNDLNLVNFNITIV